MKSNPFSEKALTEKLPWGDKNAAAYRGGYKQCKEDLRKLLEKEIRMEESLVLKEDTVIEGDLNCKNIRCEGRLHNLTVQGNINTENINARNIKAKDIDALNIKAWDIDALNIDARDINALNIKALDIDARNINAGDINAWDIKAALDIDARDINAWDIDALNINALDINTRDINAWDIKAASNINTRNIKAWNINALNIKAKDIDALNIDARNINAENISYYAFCIAYENIVCNSIQGYRKNSFHKALDGKITIKEKSELKGVRPLQRREKNESMQSYSFFKKG